MSLEREQEKDSRKISDSEFSNRCRILADEFVAKEEEANQRLTKTVSKLEVYGKEVSDKNGNREFAHNRFYTLLTKTDQKKVNNDIKATIKAREELETEVLTYAEVRSRIEQLPANRKNLFLQKGHLPNQEAVKQDRLFSATRNSGLRERLLNRNVDGTEYVTECAKQKINLSGTLAELNSQGLATLYINECVKNKLKLVDALDELKSLKLANLYIYKAVKSGTNFTESELNTLDKYIDELPRAERAELEEYFFSKNSDEVKEFIKERTFGQSVQTKSEEDGKERFIGSKVWIVSLALKELGYNVPVVTADGSESHFLSGATYKVLPCKKDGKEYVALVANEYANAIYFLADSDFRNFSDNASKQEIRRVAKVFNWTVPNLSEEFSNSKNWAVVEKIYTGLILENFKDRFLKKVA